MLVDALWSVLGVGIGLAVRHQVAAIVGSLVWVLVAEALVGAVAGTDIRSFLPAAGARAVVVDEPGLLDPAVGAVALIVWAAVWIGGSALVMARRDIA
jgi:hypothetical protein